MNLLPPRRRAGLYQEILLSAITHFLRSVAIGLTILVVLAILAGISTWVGSLVVGRMAEFELTQQVAKYNQLVSQVKEKNALLQTIDSLGKDRVVWSDLMPSLLATVPPNTTVDSLQVDLSTMTITLSGVAKIRNSLVVFEERLRLLPWVAEMTAPKTNLLDPVDAAYTFSLKVKEGFHYGDTELKP